MIASQLLRPLACLTAVFLTACTTTGPTVRTVESSCDESAVKPGEATSTAGRQHLGQGIALFDAKDLKMAERALQSALFAGLADRQERASAHKYLAFIYCTHGEWMRCESAFDAAFAAKPSFRLENYELLNTPWRDTYLKSQSQWSQRCPRTASESRTTAHAPEPVNSGFTLNSTVIVSISALPTASAGQSSSSSAVAEALPRNSSISSDDNLRLRVSPWAYVQIDGKRVGTTPPLMQMKLTPGSHTLELVNPGFESVRQTIQITEHQATTISHDFDAR